MRMFGRIDQHDAVLVEQLLIAFDHDHQIAAIPERQPGATVSERVSIHGRGRVQRRSHTGSGFAIPGAIAGLRVDAGGFPQAQFCGMRTAFVAARCKWRSRNRDFLVSVDDVLATGDFCGICLRADQYEIVVHHLETLHAETIGHKFLFGHLVMHEHHVGVAATAHVQCLPCSQRHNAHLSAGFFLEYRQQVFEQSRLFGGCSGCHGDEWLLRPGQGNQQQSRQRQRQHCSADYCHGISPLMKDAASADAGSLKNRSMGVCSISRPLLKNRISSPSRRAWPRLCVVMMILVPDA